ncbi:MAG TPA: extracellular solute-binding protein [Steroidobacteraceae bacterium]|jgi:spermidine/putrescine-binding protein|nr:extracellular solute-binding protein [Steroidobacteraceae bacterium]
MSQPPFSRRRFLSNASAALAAAAAGMTLHPRRARAAKAAPAADNVVRILGISNGAPFSWSEFEKDTGLKVEWTPIGDDVGVFLHEMIANDAGERYDIVTCLTGAYEPLAEQDLLLPIDTGRLSHWPGISELIRKATPVATGGKGVWSIPFQLNADAFCYFWKELGEPDAPGEVSWKLVFDDKRTLGRVALDGGLYTIPYCAIYLKYHKIVSIGDIANMTRSECDSVASYLLERKKAGQFRAYYKSFDEQVQLLTNREVLAETCWEPAARAAQAKGLAVAHAYTTEGYDKWAQSLMIPAQVKDRGSLDKALKTIDWIMGGAYAAEKSALEGYLTPRPDLGIAYAREHQWPAAKIASIEATVTKMNTKFVKDLYWDPGYTKSLEYYESAMARFRS